MGILNRSIFIPEFKSSFCLSSTSTRSPQPYGKPLSGSRRRVHSVIFEADTRHGRLFDLWLILAIAASVTVVMLNSVAVVAQRYVTAFDAFESGFTRLFTARYLLRLACVRQRPSSQEFRGV